MYSRITDCLKKMNVSADVIARLYNDQHLYLLDAIVKDNLPVVYRVVLGGAKEIPNAIHIACTAKKYHIARFLIASDNSYWNKEERKVVLRTVCGTGDMNLLKFLLSYRSQWSIDDWNEGLRWAGINKMFDVAEFAIRCGANQWNTGMDYYLQQRDLGRRSKAPRRGRRFRN